MSSIIEKNLAATIQKAETLAALLKKYHPALAVGNDQSTSIHANVAQSIPPKSIQVSQNQTVTQTASVLESANPVSQSTSSKGFWAKLFNIFHF